MPSCFAGSWSVETRVRNRILCDAREAASCIWDTACSTTFAFSARTGWRFSGRPAAALCGIRRPTEPHTVGEYRLWNKRIDHKRGKIWLSWMGKQTSLVDSSFSASNVKLNPHQSPGTVRTGRRPNDENPIEFPEATWSSGERSHHVKRELGHFA